MYNNVKCVLTEFTFCLYENLTLCSQLNLSVTSLNIVGFLYMLEKSTCLKHFFFFLLNPGAAVQPCRAFSSLTTENKNNCC